MSISLSALEWYVKMILNKLTWDQLLLHAVMLVVANILAAFEAEAEVETHFQTTLAAAVMF